LTRVEPAAALLSFDQQIRGATINKVAGVDEAGRGSWAGPVVAAAVILPPGWAPPLLNDSKRLSANHRTQLFAEIRAHAECWHACAVSPSEIDLLNILQATLLAMSRSVCNLRKQPDLVLVDGVQSPRLDCLTRTIIGGDGKSAAIAAASVVAKVLRDRIMTTWDHIHPGYGFAQHKGYGSAQHREALLRLGPSPLHRRSYRPVASLAQGRLWNDSGSGSG
jgi:ribonuclease HII